MADEKRGIYLYRTVVDDDEGDPLDHGVARGTREEVIQAITERLRTLEIDGLSVYLYPLEDVEAGILKRVKDSERETLHSLKINNPKKKK